MNTYFLCCIILVFIKSAISDKSQDVLVLTVASEKTDGYERYLRSAKHYGIEVQTLGMDTEWLGGDMNMPGGGYKINLLREAIKQYKGDDKKIIIFTDSFDVVFLSPLDELIEKFKKTGAKIVFGAEHYCWPDKTLKDSYPPVDTGAKFLNSGMFMGFASNIYELLKAPIKNKEDDQLYFTNLYLDKEFREKNNMKLDHNSEIFQNLNGALTEVELNTDEKTGEYNLKNLIHLTNPSVIHGNGLSKLKLNQFGNYIAGAFVNNECKLCNTDNEDLDENNLPIVTMALFIEKPWPFFEEFLIQTLAIDYPKSKIHLFVHNNAKYHEPLVNEFLKNSGPEYKSSKKVTVDDKIDESDARNIAAKYAMKKESDYLFVVDAEAHIDNQQVLRILIKEKRGVIAPMMTRDGNVWSNFWGAISTLGYYTRSTDYMEIASKKLRGLWNVPFVSACYLVEKSVIPQLSYKHEELDPDMAMCAYLREKNIFMHVLNLDHYGHLINGESFDITLTRPDFYTLMTNKANWEHRYIHKEYITELHPDTVHKQPCPDVYWLPIATERFCSDMIAIMEAFGKWSDGTNSDVRLQGGYEAVPTRDIHMNQVGLEPLWLQFLQSYVRPLQEQIFTGYFHNPPRSLMNFVVRYRPDEQPSLRPHHDSSTYTINIALNTPGVDYEGGGCRFIRYNCSVLDTKPGWMLMHPGRLTHFHEGLKVTKGTRYIMISFVDP